MLPVDGASDSAFPTLGDVVVTENEFCGYGDSPPYVTDVNSSHPKIKQAMRKLGPGWRSTFAYADWRVSYGLERENSGTDTTRRNAKVCNFIRVLCGEYRDYPEMIEAKLDVIGERQVYAGPIKLKSSISIKICSSKSPCPLTTEWSPIKMSTATTSPTTADYRRPPPVPR